VRDTRKPERATERIEVRWRPSEKEAVQRAAKSADLSVAIVVVNGALREAGRIERESKRKPGG
jgi:uncharacterized protein (DUF1778 family)